MGPPLKVGRGGKPAGAAPVGSPEMHGTLTPPTWGGTLTWRLPDGRRKAEATLKGTLKRQVPILAGNANFA